MFIKRYREEGYKEEHLSEAQSAPPHTHKQVGGAVGGRQVEESHLPVREGLPYSATLDPLQVGGNNGMISMTV